MIVKVRTNDEGWEYFNCPKGVKIRRLTKEQWKYVWRNKDTNYIICNCTNFSQESILNIKMTVIIFDNIKIYTDSIVYLLNDEGKTIDKLN